MPTHTTLKGYINEVSNSLLSDQLESNLVNFFSWGLLGVGGFFNVTIPTSGAYGGDFHKLSLVDDPNYELGQVWQAARQDWVWETGVQYHTQPIQVSGVYVNGVFQPGTGVGGYAHHVDHPLGRIVFDSPISNTAVVTCEYSHRLFHFTTADAPWWRQVQANSMRPDDAHFLQQGSGDWSMLGQSRIQVPAVVVEATTRTNRKPFELGNSTATVSQDVHFHILADNHSDRKQLHDIITYQWMKRLNGFDKNLMFQADKFPVTADGALASGAMMYPDLVKPTGDGGFGWQQIRIMDARSGGNRTVGGLFYGTAILTCEVDLP